MDFQRATLAYIWSTPLVSFAQWKHSFETELDAISGQIVLHETYRNKLGGLTYNTTTPYALAFIDVGKGPWNIDVPKGEVRGAVHNMWQIGLGQMTKPGKYLLVGPDAEASSDTNKYKVVKSDTNNIFFGIRLMSKDAAERIRILKQINIYPYSERKNPKPRGYVETAERK